MPLSIPTPKIPRKIKPLIDLSSLSEEELLELRLCDLPLKIEGTWLAERVQQLHEELAAKGINLHPACYLADEWLTPLNEPVIGIPFYLAHPVLTALEKKMMLEAEGEDPQECSRLLRHEAGHAICYGFGLHKKKKWREVFGDPRQEYPDTYRSRPFSKNYVRHLENYYAQYHPDEDFGETFAVWLTPELDWQAQYRGWGALKKLKFVDELMNEMKGKAPTAASGEPFWSISTIKMTLRTFYKKKKHFMAEELPDFHDTNLRRVFVSMDNAPSRSIFEITRVVSASRIVEKHRTQLLASIATWTGEKKYVINELLSKIARRCQELKLVAVDPEVVAVLKITSYVTTLIMNYQYTGWFRGRLHKLPK